MMTAVALCALGAERILAMELRRLTLPILDSSHGRVRFQAELPGLYRALMELRCADRVLLEAASFPANNFDELFEGIKATAWEDLIPIHSRVVIVKVRSNHSKLKAQTSIQAVSHKAVAQRLTQAWKIQRLAETGQITELRVYLDNDQASVLLDLSGEALFRRGYRIDGGLAPLRETTAAAILLALRWKRKTPLYDPFCGAGSLAAEAALYAWDAAPGLGRGFALSNLLIGDRLTEAKIRAQLLDRVNFDNLVRISGSDIDPQAVKLAQANLERAYALASGLLYRSDLQQRGGYRTTKASHYRAQPASQVDQTVLPPADRLPSFKVKDAAEARPPYPAGLLVANPPYGERLGDRAAAEDLYRSMTSFFDRFGAWSMAILTNHPGFESFFGHTATTIREFTSGASRSYLYHYDCMGREVHVDHRRAR